MLIHTVFHPVLGEEAASKQENHTAQTDETLVVCGTIVTNLELLDVEGQSKASPRGTILLI